MKPFNRRCIFYSLDYAEFKYLHTFPYLDYMILHSRWIAAAQNGKQLIRGNEVKARKYASFRFQILI